MLMRRRDFIKAAIGTAAAWPISSRAESFPSRPITLIVPFAAGGPTDVLARILAEQMRRTLGQTVGIENVTDASGRVAGALAALNDLMAGHIDLMFDQATNSLPQVRGGNVRAYAVTSRTRLASAPDIPTVDEAGLPGLYIAYWHGIWAPKNTPADAIARLNVSVVAALADPSVQQRFLELGQETPPPDRQTPSALKSHQTAEIEKWWPIVKAANIKAE